MLTPQNGRKLAHELRERNGSIAKAKSQAALTDVSRQIVYNYITRSKEFIFKK